ncbi:unnamed protein product [Caenorhabditis auriculariae]|uniref:Uncharacterized protein n=1 Tax=Caenorhabditis auriculariae TaxID=2777116 RepID=A0A8S1H7J8_9PELO|nr:unnamed protein product [Caenorhabditis auriculariae]
MDQHNWSNLFVLKLSELLEGILDEKLLKWPLKRKIAATVELFENREREKEKQHYKAADERSGGPDDERLASGGEIYEESGRRSCAEAGEREQDGCLIEAGPTPSNAPLRNSDRRRRLYCVFSEPTWEK